MKQLNQKLSSIRYCIEKAFEICKNYFQLFNYPLKYVKDGVKEETKLITAIFILHNFLFEVEELNDERKKDFSGQLDCYDDERNEGEIDDTDDQNIQDFSTRDILLGYNL